MFMIISMIHLVINILCNQIPKSRSMQEEETLLRLLIAEEGRRRNVKFKRVIMKRRKTKTNYSCVRSKVEIKQIS